MITPSLRRAVLHWTIPQSLPLPHPAVPSRTAAFSPRTHQRRPSSSKPPSPPNYGRASVPSPSVKNVTTPRSKQSPTEKRSGAVSRLSRRNSVRGTADYAADQEEPWTVNLPSVPNTQHLDPKGTILVVGNQMATMWFVTKLLA